MGVRGASGPVLVAVENPEHVQQLVRTAGDLARLGSGTVRLVTVAVKPHDSPFGVYADETIVREYAADSHALLARASPPPGVAIERDIVVARTVSKGVLRAVSESDPAALVVGWKDHSRRSDAVLGTTVDALVERATCDLYVERIGHEANGVDSILLPVAGGPHVEVSATVSKAIAVRNEARVHIYSVATPESDPESPGRYVAEGRRAVRSAPGPEIALSSSIREAEDVTQAIVAESADHDVVVMGATRQGAIRRQLVGSVPRRVVRRTERTVILARDGGVVGGPLGRLGEFLRR